MLSREDYLAAWSRWHGGTGTESPLVRGWLSIAYALARPLVGLPPVVATALGLAVAALAVWPAAVGGPWLVVAGVLVGLSGLLDSLDGALAIGTGRASRRGFVLDSVVDRLTEAAYAAALWVGRRARLAGGRLRRALLAARLPARAGGPGRGCGDRRAVGLGAAHPGGHDRHDPRRRGCGRRRRRRAELVVTAGTAVGALLGAVARRPARDVPAPDARGLSPTAHADRPGRLGGRPDRSLSCPCSASAAAHPTPCGRLRRTSPEGATRARRRHRLHRHRPPDDLPREVHGAVRRGADGERLALLPRRRPGPAPGRGGRQHGLRPRPARAAAGARRRRRQRLRRVRGLADPARRGHRAASTGRS